MIAFTKLGSKLTAGIEPEFLSAFGQLDWQEYQLGDKLAFSTGLLIREAMQQLQLRKLSHYAVGNLGRLGIVALRCNCFIGGPVNIYIADHGHEATVLASEQLIAVASAAA